MGIEKVTPNAKAETNKQGLRFVRGSGGGEGHLVKAVEVLAGHVEALEHKVNEIIDHVDDGA